MRQSFALPSKCRTRCMPNRADWAEDWAEQEGWAARLAGTVRAVETVAAGTEKGRVAAPGEGAVMDLGAVERAVEAEVGAMGAEAAGGRRRRGRRWMGRSSPAPR